MNNQGFVAVGIEPDASIFVPPISNPTIMFCSLGLSVRQSLKMDPPTCRWVNSNKPNFLSLLKDETLKISHQSQNYIVLD